MTRPIPSELLTRIQEHAHWVKTFREEGQQFVSMHGAKNRSNPPFFAPPIPTPHLSTLVHLHRSE
jgi:hypothetical protein